jgi:hypothetical protein
MAINLIQYATQTTAPKRRGLISKITNESVFLKMLNFITVDGFTYEYNLEETLGGIQFRGLNEDYTDESVGTINPKIESLARFGGYVRTDRAIAKLPSGDAVRANRIASKVKKAGLFYDKYVIDGDPAVDPRQFYGLNARLTGNQVLNCGANGGALTLDLVMRIQDATVGTNNQKVLIMNKADHRGLTNLVVASAGGAAVRDVAQLIANFNDSNILVIDEDGDEQPILGKDETMGASNVTSSIYCVRAGSDTDGEYMQGLVNTQMIEHDDQGVRGTQQQDLIEAGLGLAVFHPRAAARLKGII